jgi:hypothetical protein
MRRGLAPRLRPRTASSRSPHGQEAADEMVAAGAHRVAVLRAAALDGRLKTATDFPLAA